MIKTMIYKTREIYRENQNKIDNIYIYIFNKIDNIYMIKLVIKTQNILLTAQSLGTS